MENFKHVVKRRLVVSVVYFLIVLLLIVLSATLGRRSGFPSFAQGFGEGFGTGIGAIMVFFIAKYIGALKNEDKLKALYIEETDERLQYIQTKAGSKGIDISIACLALAMLIANYFNSIVFLTLLGAAMFLTLVKLGLKIYYKKTV